ncbi:XRE family transcriptional regulator, partial [Kitasatospora sp. NPDC093558]|uniref:XRE family transcriptional regulator n=1 Tax=Kitasatospora sp. NPDC093558 TaxID=3155201 RepID=UPI00341D078E
DSQVLLSDVFSVPEDSTGLGWPHWLPGWDDVLPLGAAYTVRALREARTSMLDRRTFVTFGSAALVGLAAQWALVEPERLTAAIGGKRVDPDLVGWLESTGAKLTGLPTKQRQHTAVLLDAHLATVTDLVDGGRYSEPIGLRLHSLAAQLAVACGWYRFDQGRHPAAGKLWNAALRSAHASGDRDLGAGVLSDFAYQAMWLKDPGTAVEVLGFALTRTTHPTARSLLGLRKARAHAALGESVECHGELSAAEGEFSRRTADPAPSWCAWMSPADLAVDAGQCFLDLGRPDVADGLIGDGMALLPRSRDKTRAVFLAARARAFLQRGDVEQAAAVTDESLDLAQRIGAERCVTMVRDLVPEFRRFPAVDGVPELLERLRAA